MRLWSLHPRYLDPQGLVALWREALLAQAVLRGETRGYRSHPQLQRFREQPSPIEAISAYLAAVHAEATLRGYSFDRSKFEAPSAGPVAAIPVTIGQIEYEWQHLMSKLALRNPELRLAWNGVASPDGHPLFRLVPGDVAPWERKPQ
ncbi:MAG: pyrimidine dimer DNA glycosylase/endonuclease V [Gammaproteobacteria bacterium]|nr:pyrimidine dimer DNA glycosylase/endonuclease V [Gammaproteobacteria bacterium]MBU1646495.1 pyrimidine dimer DNA glycosylase/endonuclease V [Gammaproteobacteria bacterium]MBU1971038.1 pyrimidine dimer DNA glycosylase/endonuclease V [Gammaproteobacteria bacterium]